MAIKYTAALVRFRNTYHQPYRDARRFDDVPLANGEHASITMHLASLVSKWQDRVSDGDDGTAINADQTIKSQLGDLEQA